VSPDDQAPAKNEAKEPESSKTDLGNSLDGSRSTLEQTPGQPTTAQATPSDSLTEFYNRYCYLILIAAFVIDSVGAFLLFRFYRQIALHHFLLLVAFIAAAVWGLFGIVGDRSRIHKNKRIATYVVGCMVPAVQLLLGYGWNELNKKQSVIQDSTDLATLQKVYETVQHNDSKPGASTVKDVNEVLPTLKHLTDKYPLHPQLLFTLGLAEYEARQYEDAKKTFEQFIAVSPNEFKGHYYLGISLKAYADQLEKDEIKAKNLEAWYCGAPAGAWMRKQNWKPEGIEQNLREQAKNHLEESLSYYYEPLYGEQEERLGIKIARNIGWLWFQLSNGCQDEEYCLNAIAWHERALGWKPTDHFVGDSRYVLALNNLGDIYRAIGDTNKSYGAFCEGVKIHQEMLGEDPQRAKNVSYSCLYKEFAHFLDEDNRKEEAAKIDEAGKGIFHSTDAPTPKPSYSQIFADVCRDYSVPKSQARQDLFEPPTR
jgi:tetratricopeptide (TPR) repeat protein